jgi:hypothetical protein
MILVKHQSFYELELTEIEEKGVLGLSQRHYLEKDFKEIKYACE